MNKAVRNYRTSCCKAEPYESNGQFLCGKCNRDVWLEMVSLYYEGSFTEKKEEKLVN